MKMMNKMLSVLVDMLDCDNPPARRCKLSGRARFSIDIVSRLVATGSVQDSKQATLDNAIDDMIEHVMSGLRNGVRTISRATKQARQLGFSVERPWPTISKMQKYRSRATSSPTLWTGPSADYDHILMAFT